MLDPRDLIPMLSFALSAGRCRHCGAPIPPWLLYIELAATGLALWALILGQSPTETWLIAVFLWLLMALIATDLIGFRLPDLLTGALVPIALMLAWTTGFPGLEMALLGGMIGAGSFGILRLGYRRLRRREGLGLGDVKLMAGLGAALGPHDLPLMLLLASLSSLAAAFAGASGRQAHRLSANRPLPFGAALAAATGLLWMARHLPA